MANQLSGLRVAVLIEDGVNEIEYHYCRLRIRETGAQVVVIGNHKLDYTGEGHGRLRADGIIDAARPEDFDGVILPGGLAPEKLRQNQTIVDFVRGIYDRGKVCAAICHGQQLFISAGMLRGRLTVAAWSMVDDLIHTGAKHDPAARAVRDGTLVTARFPSDLPEFFSLILSAFADTESRQVSDLYGSMLRGKTIGIVVDDASNDMQVIYPQYRMKEEGATVLLIGRSPGGTVRLGNDTWEWADLAGIEVAIDRALENMGAVDSHDFPYEQEQQAVRAVDLDGLALPGGLGTWMIRGHKGLKKLVRDLVDADRPITAIGRGPKILLSANSLANRHITCSPAMRDDIVAAGIDYSDEPVVLDRKLLTCRGTEDLPAWGPAWMSLF